MNIFITIPTKHASMCAPTTRSRKSASLSFAVVAVVLVTVFTAEMPVVGLVGASENRFHAWLRSRFRMHWTQEIEHVTTMSKPPSADTTTLPVAVDIINVLEVPTKCNSAVVMLERMLGRQVANVSATLTTGRKQVDERCKKL